MTLYAVAVEEYKRGKWVPDIIHLKAEDRAHARNQFTVAYPNRRVCRIVAIGIAVGVFANEDDGEQISTDC